MALSARNSLHSTVVSVKKDEITAEIVVELGDGRTVSTTTPAARPTASPSRRTTRSRP
jgi:molybdopterin-binding protein